MFKATACCLLTLSIVTLFSCNNSSNSNAGDALFTLVPSSESGVKFSNTVADTRELNIFSFRNFYNGAGVATGDINNDGLADIFFTANQSGNKLYLNKGNFQFEDITAKSGIAETGKWFTGVTMVDINADGWLDIYICNSGALGQNKANDLYINQQNGTFKEQAKEFGLDDIGLSTHAAFFDYDHDGDLDCFVLNNSPRSIESFGYNKSVRSVRDSLNGDRFYRNDSGHFKDISPEAGIYGSEIGFGLGITVGDVNNDGWEDMYISNDFFERDYLYINQRNGKFSEVINDAMGHISQGSMGSDMIDINNDGWLDVFTTEMLPESDFKLKTTIKFDDYDVQNARLQNDFHHQFTSNCLQLNNGDGTFSEIAQLAGLDATGWSWGALGFDFDNDGMKDIFVCNGISKDLTDQDFLEFFGSSEVLNKVRNGGFDFTDILDKMPSNKLPNYAFLNKGDLRFINAGDSLGFSTPSFSNGAAYADLDNDGDLDLVVNNENLPAFLYRNNASEQSGNHFLKIGLHGAERNTSGIGARVTIVTKTGKQIIEQMPSRGFQSSVEHLLHFGVGKNTEIDSIVVRWPGDRYEVRTNTPVDTTLTFDEKNAEKTNIIAPQLSKTLWQQEAGMLPASARHRENIFVDFDTERLIPKMLSTEGPALAAADINGDGMEDFFLSNSVGDTAKLFLQQKNGRFVESPDHAFAGDRYFETTAALFMDVDKDHDQDLILGAGGNQAPQGSPYLNLRCYLNDGRGNFIKDSTTLPPLSVNASCITAFDMEGDGDDDLFVGARCIPGRYGVPPTSRLLRNDGNGKFSDITVSGAAILKDLGMVTATKAADVNEDGRTELIIAGDWMPVMTLGFQNGSLKKLGTIPESNGWWNCIELNDIDSDGDIDIVAGNAGLNSRIKATAEKPAKLYVGDFDQNGQIECIPVYFKTDGKAYPYFMKGELQQQIPSLKKDFLYFSDYAGKSIEQIFTPEQLKNVSTLEVDQAASCLYENDGRGNFTCKPLPLMAQLSYMYGVSILDLNGDGLKDIFMAGNFYGLKPQGGRFDGSYGVSLMNEGRNMFKYMPPGRSGLFVNGESRNIREVKMKNGSSCLMVAMNNDAIKVFERTK